MQRRFYRSVPANSSEQDDFIIPTGTKLQLTEIGLNAGSSPETSVKLVWDGTILASTHGDVIQQNIREQLLEGDGVKILTIKLTNDQNQVDDLGGYFYADELKA